MRLGSLWRSTPFRLALTFAVMFIAAFLVAALVTYQLFKQELVGNLDRSITELHALVASTYGDGDLEDLTGTVDTYARLTQPDDSVFALVDPQGRRLAGNFNPRSVAEGISTASGTDLGLAVAEDYRLMTGTVGENRLIIAQSFRETDHLEDIALTSFVWAAVGVLVLAVVGGILVAVRAQRRLDGIAMAMTAVSHGALETRIPLKGNGDDIDLVSRQINDALARLSTLVETMRQVSSDIAHELKTPLNRLKLYIEEAGDREEAGLDAGASIASARDEADQINATFEALLQISQIEAGARKSRFRQVNLTDVLVTIAEIYTVVAEDAGMTLAHAIDAQTEVHIHGDRELLTQLFVNLVENAIRHCPAGAEITLRLDVDERLAVARVADTGTGIPEDEHERVFRRLYRLDKSRTTQGSGLGLSLVRAVADLHEGRVELSDNQPGLRVDVMLPIASAV